MKLKALYSAMDTFSLATATRVEHRTAAVHTHATYETLGVVLISASDDMLNALWQSCVNGHRPADSNDLFRLLEAHLFSEVRMDRDVDTLFLSWRRQDGDSPITAGEWETIKANAQVWSRRNGNIRVDPLD